jgi:hypothetical protein
MVQQMEPQATHEVVLGDLFGSQWIKDDEFANRVTRYKNIIFKDVHPQDPATPCWLRADTLLRDYRAKCTE